MQRAFGLDVLACPCCGGRLRLVATISDPRVAEFQNRLDYPPVDSAMARHPSGARK